MKCHRCLQEHLFVYIVTSICETSDAEIREIRRYFSTGAELKAQSFKVQTLDPELIHLLIVLNGPFYAAGAFPILCAFGSPVV